MIFKSNGKLNAATVVCALLLSHASQAATSPTYDYSVLRGLSIPDNSSSGRSGTRVVLSSDSINDSAVVTKVQVGVAAEHSRVADLSIELTSPSGKRVTLVNQTSSGWQDAGSGVMAIGQQTDSFDNELIKGANGWILRIADRRSGNAGVIRQATIQFAYEVPRISGVTPNSAILNIGQNFTINGNNLPSSIAYTIADANCSRSSVTPSRAVFRCTPQASGNKEYIVKDRSQGNSLRRGTISVNEPLPSVSSFTPLSLQTSDNYTSFTIRGSNFTNNTVAAIQGADCRSTTFNSSNRLTVQCRHNQAATLTYTVKVSSQGADAQGASRGNIIFTVPEPTVSSFIPQTAQVSSTYTTFTVNGSNFTNNAVAFIQGADCLNTSFINSSRLTVQCRHNQAAVLTYTVKKSSGGQDALGSSRGNVTFELPQPTVVRFSPASTEVSNSYTTFTITGNNFNNQMAAAIQGADCLDVNFINEGQLTLQCRHNQAEMLPYSVKLSSGGSDAAGASRGSITFRNPDPNVSSFSPTSTSVSDTYTTFTISGGNFTANMAAAIQGADCQPVSFISNTELNLQCRHNNAETLTYSVKVESNGADALGASRGSVDFVDTPLEILLVDGFPKSTPATSVGTAQIGEPVKFEIKLSSPPSRVELDMGGGRGFQPMEPVSGGGRDGQATHYEFDRTDGFATNTPPTKTVTFHVYGPDQQLALDETLNQEVSSSIYPRPYRKGNPATQAVPSVKGVAMLTGGLFLSNTDMTVDSLGLDFILSRSYNYDQNRTLKLWNFNIESVVTSSDSGNFRLTMHEGDGSETRYYRDLWGKWQAYDRTFDIILENDNDKSLTRYTKQDIIYEYEPLINGGKLTGIKDRFGNGLSLTYDNTEKLDYILDSSSRRYEFSYNNLNQLTSVTDFSGRRVLYTWEDNTITKVTDVRGFDTVYSYDAGRKLTRITDPRGNFVEYQYNNSRQVNRFIDQDQNQFVYQYSLTGGKVDSAVRLPISDTAVNVYRFDERGRLTETIDSLNNRNKSTYQNPISSLAVAEALLVSSQRDPKNNPETFFTYSTDGLGNRTKVQQPLGRTSDLAWESTERPTQVNSTNQHLLKIYKPSGSGSEGYQYSYTDEGRVTQAVNPIGDSTAFEYEPTNGLLLKRTDANGFSTTFEYDINGNLNKETDPLGAFTQYTRDSLGRATRVRDKRGLFTNYTYDAAGNVLTETDPLNNQVSYLYDGNGNLVRTTDANGTSFINAYTKSNFLSSTEVTVGGQTYTQSYTYDALNRVVSSTNRNSKANQNVYDLVGNVLENIDPIGNKIAYTYDKNNNIETQTDEEGRKVSYTYNALNQVVSITDDEGNTQLSEYNLQGLLSKSTDGRSNATRYNHNEAGQLISVIDANEATTRSFYDAVGNRTRVVDPNGNSTYYSFDSLNRLVELRDDDNRKWEYKYDNNSNRTQEIKPDGSKLTYTFDDANRLRTLRELDVSGTTTRTINYGYDANGNITSKSNGSSILSYTYDELNRVKTATDHFGQVIAYQYDGVGNLTELAYPNNKKVTYGYDAAERLQTVTDWLGKTTEYTRNKSGQVTLTKLGNGALVTQSFDSAGRLTSLINKKSDDTIISSHQMTLDGNGNITQANTVLPLEPDLTQLPELQVMTYDDTNRIQTAGTSTFSHDPNGRLIETNNVGDTTAYNFNAQDLITSIQENSATTALYFYDANNNRVSKTIDGLETRFVVDANVNLSRVLAETNTTGTVQHYYVYGEGLISQIDSSNNAKYYHYDQTGNTLALTTASQNVSDKYAYTPYGGVTKESTSNNPFQFSGKYGVQDDGNELNFVRARYYSNNLTRFLSLDLLWGDLSVSNSLNRYVYGLNNPISNIDPSGLVTVQAGVCGSVSIVVPSIDGCTGYAFASNSFSDNTIPIVDRIPELGIYYSSSVGGSTSFGASAVGTAAYSNNNTLADISGGSVDYSVGGYYGYGGEVGVALPFDNNLKPFYVAKVGIGGEISASAGVTYTKVISVNKMVVSEIESKRRQIQNTTQFIRSAAEFVGDTGEAVDRFFELKTTEELRASGQGCTINMSGGVSC